jgi:hypothetical protein
MIYKHMLRFDGSRLCTDSDGEDRPDGSRFSNAAVRFDRFRSRPVGRLAMPISELISTNMAAIGRGR